MFIVAVVHSIPTFSTSKMVVMIIYFFVFVEMGQICGDFAVI